MKRDYANYHVAFKILLQKGDEFLFLRQLPANKWDFPGGRIDDVEHDVPLLDILDREVREELGSDLQYKVGKPIVQYRRHYKEKDYHIFITTYSAEYASGEIVLSDEHGSYEWINSKKYAFQREDFYTQEEYDAIMNYLNQL